MDGHEAGDVVRMERARARHYTSYNFAELVVEEERVIESARMPEPENAALRVEKAAPAKPRAKKKKKKATIE